MRPTLKVIQGGKERIEEAAMAALLAGRQEEFMKMARRLERRAELTVVLGGYCP